MTSRHSKAVAVALADERLTSLAQHAPLVELCRTLAAQMDAAGSEPSTRLTAAYLSALKDLRRAFDDVPVRPTSSRLALMRERRGTDQRRTS
jgi:hypothetical protein